MSVRIVDLGGDYLTGLIQSQHAIDDARRPSGLHLSDIVFDYIKTAHPNWYKHEMEEERKRALFELGNTFEDVIAAGLRQTLGFEKPEPRKIDGVWMSPDGYRADRSLIDEIKLTWCSAKDGLAHPKLKKYLMQTLAYMYGWKAERARIHVFYVNGDWRPPLPRPHTYLILPTQEDILHNWFMLTTHAQDRGWLQTSSGALRRNHSLSEEDMG